MPSSINLAAGSPASKLWQQSAEAFAVVLQQMRLFFWPLLLVVWFDLNEVNATSTGGRLRSCWFETLNWDVHRNRASRRLLASSFGFWLSVGAAAVDRDGWCGSGFSFTDTTLFLAPTDGVARPGRWVEFGVVGVWAVVVDSVVVFATIDDDDEDMEDLVPTPRSLSFLFPIIWMAGFLRSKKTFH